MATHGVSDEQIRSQLETLIDRFCFSVSDAFFQQHACRARRGNSESKYDLVDSFCHWLRLKTKRDRCEQYDPPKKFQPRPFEALWEGHRNPNCKPNTGRALLKRTMLGFIDRNMEHLPPIYRRIEGGRLCEHAIHWFASIDGQGSHLIP